MSDHNRVSTEFGSVAHLTEEPGYTSQGPVRSLCGREFVPYHPEGARICETCRIERIANRDSE